AIRPAVLAALSHWRLAAQRVNQTSCETSQKVFCTASLESLKQVPGVTCKGLSKPCAIWLAEASPAFSRPARDGRRQSGLPVGKLLPFAACNSLQWAKSVQCPPFLFQSL